MPDYTVRLIGPDDRRVRLVGPLVADVFETLSKGSQGAVRLRLDGRSFARGTQPAWLARASLFDLKGVDAEQSLIFLSAPPLGDTLPEGSPYHDLVEEDDRAKTSLGLLTESIQDALRQEEQADSYDVALARAFAEGFNGVFNHGVVGFQMGNGHARSPFIDLAPTAIATFEALRPRSYDPQYVRVAGKLDVIRDSDRAFVLVTDNGTKVRGILADDPVHRMTDHFGEWAVVSGQAVFRPSGALALIDAARINPANDADRRMWGMVPKPSDMPTNYRALATASQGPRSGVNAMVGKWPVEMTREEHARALDYLTNLK